MNTTSGFDSYNPPRGSSMSSAHAAYGQLNEVYVTGTYCLLHQSERLIVRIPCLSPAQSLVSLDFPLLTLLPCYGFTLPYGVVARASTCRAVIAKISPTDRVCHRRVGLDLFPRACGLCFTYVHIRPSWTFR